MGRYITEKTWVGQQHSPGNSWGWKAWCSLPVKLLRRGWSQTPSRGTTPIRSWAPTRAGNIPRPITPTNPSLGLWLLQFRIEKCIYLEMKICWITTPGRICEKPQTAFTCVLKVELEKTGVFLIPSIYIKNIGFNLLTVLREPFFSMAQLFKVLYGNS